jgi:hypothetical protein
VVSRREQSGNFMSTRNPRERHLQHPRNTLALKAAESLALPTDRLSTKLGGEGRALCHRLVGQAVTGRDRPWPRGDWNGTASSPRGTGRGRPWVGLDEASSGPGADRPINLVGLMASSVSIQVLEMVEMPSPSQRTPSP